MVRHALDSRGIGGDCLVDVGCGAGNLFPVAKPKFRRYLGADVVRYDGFPKEAEFCEVDLDTGRVPLPSESADVVAAIEVIEHLENPRSFFRELVRLVKPRGWIVVTTPNQLSFLSLITLLFKHRFQAFQDIHYPTHLTALLEIDLIRIARECGLEQIGIEYSLNSRVPSTALRYPQALSRNFPRAFSDNILLIGQKPD